MKRRLVKLAVFLLLGAIVNVAVAWGCALWSGAAIPTENWTFGKPDAELASWWHARFPESDLTFPSAAPIPADMEPSHREMVFLEQVRTTGLRGLSLHHQRDHLAVSSTYAGWPMESMMGEQRFRQHIRQDVMLVHCSWRPRSKTGDWDYVFDRFVPLQPLWLGFTINTVFYAFVLCLLFAAPFALRRWRRIRRGLCPACAYPIGDSEVCTECGAMHSPRGVGVDA